MPTGLYYSKTHDSGAHVVSRNYQFYIENSTALELVHRLNVGGSSISSFLDSGMFREWSDDSNYLIESDVYSIITTIPIKYTSIPTYTAPQKVYQTTWSMTSNLTWRLPVDLGFRYLVRLHFCELEYGIRESGHREFSTFINEHVAEACADVIEWSGGNGIAVYRDYLVMMEGDRMEGKHDLLIALQNHCHECKAKHGMGPILNGLEVFKLSNPDNNLAGPNPLPLADTRTSKPPKLPKPVFAFDFGNGIVNGVIIFITLVNIIFYQLRTWAENFGEKKISKLSPKEEIFCRFSLAEMQLATDNFADAFVIGCGGFGKVYKGLINEGATTVAIKRLNSKSKQGEQEFWTEIKMLSKLRHSNLVTLIGYCDDYHEMILVYEYMTQGTLADHIYKSRRNSKGDSSLTWEQRLNICICAAHGLNYLHTGTNQRVIHRDVKSTNILLDDNLVAKISDFGLSKMGISGESLSHVSTNVKGTFGYLDPEYFSTRRLTRKSDVYAFGVVLLEVLCGRAAVHMRLEEEQRSLVFWAQNCVGEGMLDQVIDPCIRTQIEPGCLKLFVKVAMKCLQNHSKDRPTMDDVVGSLEFLLASHGQDHTPLPRKKTKSTITKVVQSIITRAKGKNLQKKKAKDHSSAAGSSSRLWQWNPLKPSGKKLKVKRLPTTPEVEPSPPTAPEGEPCPLTAPVVEPCPLTAPVVEPCPCFSLAEILEATKNFHDDLTINFGHSTVYKGYMEEKNLVVAVRRFKSNSILIQEVREKMEILMELRHANLPSLKGYCGDEGEAILLYDYYMGNGSLADHLFGLRRKDRLPWERRLQICIDAAKGLQYLHDDARPPVMHGNVRATNILLDENWVPKLSDLELSKVLEIWTSGDRRNTVPLLPWVMEGRLLEKYDVFLFGEVLLQVLSGEQKLTELVEPLRSCITMKRIELFIDPYLMGKIAPACLKEFVEIMCCCVLYQDLRRPSMRDVVRALQRAMQLQQETSILLGSHGAPGLGDDSTDLSFKAEVARAYNKAIPFRSIIEFESSPSTTSSDSGNFGNFFGDVSCAASDDDPDYYSSNLGR